MWESLPADQVDRTDIREKDAVTKLDSKQYADVNRGAKESKITVGDKVLLAHHPQRKGQPTFSEERYTVLTRDGAKVVVQSDRGVQYSRNIQDVKKVPITLQENQHVEPVEEEEYSVEVQLPDISTNIPAEPETERGRPKRISKKPSRFNDMVLFSVFD